MSCKKKQSKNYMLCADRKGKQELNVLYRQKGRATIKCPVQTGREGNKRMDAFFVRGGRESAICIICIRRACL